MDDDGCKWRQNFLEVGTALVVARAARVAQIDLPGLSRLWFTSLDHQQH